jgi:hypothetical protein
MQKHFLLPTIPPQISTMPADSPSDRAAVTAAGGAAMDTDDIGGGPSKGSSEPSTANPVNSIIPQGAANTSSLSSSSSNPNASSTANADNSNVPGNGAEIQNGAENDAVDQNGSEDAMSEEEDAQMRAYCVQVLSKLEDFCSNPEFTNEIQGFFGKEAEVRNLDRFFSMIT